VNRSRYRLSGSLLRGHVVRRFFRLVLTHEWLFNLLHGISERVLTDRRIPRLYEWFGRVGSRRNGARAAAPPATRV